MKIYMLLWNRHFFLKLQRKQWGVRFEEKKPGFPVYCRNQSSEWSFVQVHQPYSYVKGQTKFTNQNNISLLASTWGYSASVPLNCMEKIANDIFSLSVQ